MMIEGVFFALLAGIVMNGPNIAREADCVLHPSEPYNQKTAFKFSW